MRVLNAEIGEVNGLAFSPDGRALAAAVEDQGVFLWNLDNDDPPLQLDPTARRNTRTLYFTPDSRAVGWAGSTGWKVFDRSRKRVAQLSLDAGGKLTWITQTPDGSRVVFVRKQVGSKNDYLVDLWMAPTDGGPASRFTSGGKDMHPRWSPDGVAWPLSPDVTRGGRRSTRFRQPAARPPN